MDIQAKKREIIKYTLNSKDGCSSNELAQMLNELIQDVKNEQEKIKAIKIIKEIRAKEKHFSDQQLFCSNHNFKLEAENFRTLSDEMRRVCYMIEKEFETGYVS